MPQPNISHSLSSISLSLVFSITSISFFSICYTVHSLSLSLTFLPHLSHTHFLYHIYLLLFHLLPHLSHTLLPHLSLSLSFSHFVICESNLIQQQPFQTTSASCYKRAPSFQRGSVGGGGGGVGWG